MRWLFLIVLSLNLAYIAWQISLPDEDSSISVQPLKNLQPIVLLSELAVPAVQQDKIVQSASKQQRAEETVAEPTIVAEKTIEVEEVESVDASPAEVVAENKPAAMPAKVKESDFEPPVVPVLAKKALPAPLLPETSCYTLGPFRDLAKLRSFIRKIKSYVMEADFRSREEKEQSLFWVYLQPEKTYKKAVATGQRLKNKKIKDFYIIRDGEKLHGISLGHFRNKAGAYGLTKKVKNLGFNVHVEPVFKTYMVYWLDYQLARGVSVPESIFDEYTKLNKKGKISRLSRDCSA
ncbi:MAG: hypothetical protein KAT04_09245 [Methylococcales bacterium]|nr:hypothetical protein [Methylococcales bacterium]